MLNIGKRKFIEIEVLAATVCILVLNSLVFAGLQLDQSPVVQNIINSLIRLGIFYMFGTVLGVICILTGKRKYVRFVIYGMLLFMVAHIGVNLYQLIVDKQISDNGVAILTDAMLIWFVNILVFSLWYWIVDRGGSVNRELNSETTRCDLLFPQYQTKIQGWEEWKPKFLDYVFFSFFTSTGFSPADTLPLTKRVKLLMMVEASFSLIIIGMVVSRAISLI